MSDCNECLYSVDGICQNDGCSFDLEDNCYEFVSKTTYDNGYQKGKSDAIYEFKNKLISGMKNGCFHTTDELYEYIVDVAAELKGEKDD